MPRISQEEQDTALRVNRLADWLIGLQSAEHPRMYRNLCFYHGAQWVWWNKRYNQIEELPRTKDWQVRITENHCRQLINRAVAGYMRTDPRIQAIPVSSGEAHRLSARVVRHYMDYTWERCNVQHFIRNRALLWATVVGEGWLELGWDPDAGGEVELRIPRLPEPLPQPGEDVIYDLLASGMPNEYGPEIRRINIGDLRVGAPSPFCIYKDPDAENWEDVRYIIKVTFHPVQSVEDTYGLEPGTLHGDVSPTTSTNYSLRVMEGLRELGRNQLLESSTSVKGRDEQGRYIRSMGIYDSGDSHELVMLKEMWVRPSRKTPEGRYVIVANERCLNPRELGRSRFHNPYGDIPFIRFTCYPMLGSPYCQSLIDDLYPLQVRLNRLLSNDVAIGNMHRSSQWLVHKEALVDKNAFNDRPGQLIPYGGRPQDPPPKRIDPPSVIYDFKVRYDMTVNAMQGIVSEREASLGINPSGGRSAAVVTKLQQADEQGHALIKDNYYDSLTRLGRLMMKISQRFIAEDRVIPVTARNGRLGTALLREVDVQNCVDVRVMGDDGLPSGILPRMNMILQLAAATGLNFTDPAQREVLMRILEAADLESFFDNDDGEERFRVHMEHRLFAEGFRDVPVRPYDLTPVHIEGHRRWMASPEAQDLFQQQPEMEQVAQAHLDLHITVDRMNQPTAMLSAGQQASPPAAGAAPGSGMELPPSEAAGGPMAAAGMGA